MLIMRILIVLVFVCSSLLQAMSGLGPALIGTKVGPSVKEPSAWRVRKNSKCIEGIIILIIVTMIKNKLNE